MSRSSKDVPPKGIDEALPPWTLDAEVWVFPNWSTSSRVRSFDATAGLEPGSIHPLEDPSAWLQSPTVDRFLGGAGGWMLYRYASSPAGPYDELIYVAGVFDSPRSKTRGLRITNIYVSTEASVWNGRRNWNIPKHRADFTWSHPLRAKKFQTQTVSVSHPPSSPMLKSSNGTATTGPFFSAKMQQSSWIPYLPLNTNLFFLPALPLYQPPVRQGKHYAELDSSDQSVIASQPNNMYRSTCPTFERGRMTLAYCQPTDTRLKGYGDGLSFPRAQHTFGVGIHCPTVQVQFPLPQEHPVH